ncbi:MAG: hypothetical protein KF781_01140 [Chitinophagaceae bacterium]|nr:hypothetical protein [Chitinophagaceae bacterium]MCW5905340.1 hypothetical protein [Chitinophagaceae bacterium]
MATVAKKSFIGNEILQENWSVVSNLTTVTKEAKISYLMVEQINPPKYMWEKICQQLDMEEAIEKFASKKQLSNQTIITLLIAGSALALAASLFFLL